MYEQFNFYILSYNDEVNMWVFFSNSDISPSPLNTIVILIIINGNWGMQ